MKKLLLGIGVLSLSFSLAACGSDSASADKTGSDNNKTTQQEDKGAKETKTESQSNDKGINDNKYGEDASERNKELVNSGKLQLEFDEGDRTDKYGRMLAYVYVDGKSVQETLLKEGLARVAYVYEPNTKYIDQFKKDEQEAKSEKLSIWSKNSS